MKLYQHGENGTAPRDYAFTFLAGDQEYHVQVWIYETMPDFVSSFLPRDSPIKWPNSGALKERFDVQNDLVTSDRYGRNIINHFQTDISYPRNTVGTNKRIIPCFMFLRQVLVEYESIHYVSSDWDARMCERFCKFIVNSVPGRGVSEFHYRHKDGRPESVAKNDPEWYRKMCHQI